MIHFPERDAYIENARIEVFIDIANHISDRISKWTTHCRQDYPYASDVRRFTRRAYHCKTGEWQSFLNKLSDRHIRFTVDREENSVVIRPFESTDSIPGGEYLYLKICYGNFPFKDIQDFSPAKRKKASRSDADEQPEPTGYIYMLFGMTFISHNISREVTALKISPDSPGTNDFLNIITSLLNCSRDNVTAAMLNYEKIYHTAETEIREIDSHLKRALEEMEWHAPANITWCHYNDSLDYEVEIGSDALTTCKYAADKDAIVSQAGPLITFAKEYALLHQRYKRFSLNTKGW